MIAALYIDPHGCYSAQPGIDAWCEMRDARCYAGPYPVVAHPPCQRWGRMDHGGPSAPGTQTPGDDDGCFSAALFAVQRWGGVLEHPCDSKAWAAHGIAKPKRHAGWVRGDDYGWTCYVEQGHYGHMSRKPTWLYASVPRDKLPDLDWSKGEQRLHPTAIARYGYEKARRIGMTAMVGGKNKTKLRNATPPEFRDVLLGIARLVKQT